MTEVQTYLNYINGKWIPSSNGKTFRTLNPANQQVVACLQKSDEQDMKDAIDIWLGRGRLDGRCKQGVSRRGGNQVGNRLDQQL